MPIYLINCPRCGKQETIFRKLSEYNDLPECCGESMSRMICAPNVISDIQPYKSMVTGEIITSRSQHKRHLQQHGCTEVGNESMTPKTDHFAVNKRKSELRQEISQRLDAIS